MIYDPSPVAVIVFVLFVVGTVGLSFYLGRRAKSSAGYFAAHGQIPWAVNGVASVASAVIAVILGMTIGFSGVALTAAGVYVIGTSALLATLRDAPR